MIHLGMTGAGPPPGGRAAGHGRHPEAEGRLNDYPHQFSGGMRQRVMIAMALACTPQMLIADEPTTALDVTIQAQIVDLVKRLRQELGMAIIWITHDLGIMAGLAHRVMVMYAGFIVERRPSKSCIATRSTPTPRAARRAAAPRRLQTRRLTSHRGPAPDMLHAAQAGCPFAPRCPYVFDAMRHENPPLLPIGPEHERPVGGN